jgi:hypothetical protein
MTQSELHSFLESGSHRVPSKWMENLRSPTFGSVKCSPDEKAQLDSLIFHLEGFKSAPSQAGKLTSLRKVYEILQISHHAKKDYFGLPSLANFWRNFDKLPENRSATNAEVHFWFHAIAILVLFKNTKSMEINIPPYAMTILGGLISVALLPCAPQQTKGERTSNNPVSGRKRMANTFGNKRKFSSSSSLQEDRPMPMETELPCVESSFATKRKLAEAISSSQLEPASSFVVEIKRDDIGSIPALWSSLAELSRGVRRQGDWTRFDFVSDDLSILTVFIINRYLHLLISMGALCEEEEEESTQENSLQLQRILDHLRSSNSLGRVSSSVVNLINQDIISDEANHLDRTLLWCNFGILESACFRNISNQV